VRRAYSQVALETVTLKTRGTRADPSAMTAVAFSRPRQLLTHGPAFGALLAGIATTSVIFGAGWLSVRAMSWIAVGLLVLGLLVAVDARRSDDMLGMWRATLIAVAAGAVLAAMTFLELG
jgi:hypothetical protein